MRSGKPRAWPGSTMSTVPAAADKPGIRPGEKLPPALVPRCGLRPLPAVKAPRGAAASRTGRP